MKTSRNSVKAKQRRWGWAFLIPATVMIIVMSFYPMVQALITSFKKGPILNMQMADPWYNNYTRILQDKIFITAMKNTFLYLIIQVPIMLILAMLLAQILNNKDLKFKGLFRTMVFLPCATSLVSYALIFKSLFATQGLINSVLKVAAYHIRKHQLAGYCRYRQICYYLCSDLEMDRVQHGLLSGRPAEHRLSGL